MKSKIIKVVGLLVMLFCFLILPGAAVHADELDGYTMVDWSWNRDIETTDNNSVLMVQPEDLCNILNKHIDKCV